MQYTLVLALLPVALAAPVAQRIPVVPVAVPVVPNPPTAVTLASVSLQTQVVATIPTVPSITIPSIAAPVVTIPTLPNTIDGATIVADGGSLTVGIQGTGVPSATVPAFVIPTAGIPGLPSGSNLGSQGILGGLVDITGLGIHDLTSIISDGVNDITDDRQKCRGRSTSGLISSLLEIIVGRVDEATGQDFDADDIHSGFPVINDIASAMRRSCMGNVPAVPTLTTAPIPAVVVPAVDPTLTAPSVSVPAVVVGGGATATVN